MIIGAVVDLKSMRTIKGTNCKINTKAVWTIFVANFAFGNKQKIYE